MRPFLVKSTHLFSNSTLTASLADQKCLINHNPLSRSKQWKTTTLPSLEQRTVFLEGVKNFKIKLTIKLKKLNETLINIFALQLQPAFGFKTKSRPPFWHFLLVIVRKLDSVAILKAQPARKPNPQRTILKSIASCFFPWFLLSLTIRLLFKINCIILIEEHTLIPFQ